MQSRSKVIDGIAVGEIIIHMITMKLGNETRFRISAKTLRALSGVPSKSPSLMKKFIEDIQDSLIEYGWSIIELPSEHFGVIRVNTINSWKRTGIDQFAETPRDALGRFDMKAVHAALPEQPPLTEDDAA